MANDATRREVIVSLLNSQSRRRMMHHRGESPRGWNYLLCNCSIWLVAAGGVKDGGRTKKWIKLTVHLIAGPLRWCTDNHCEQRLNEVSMLPLWNKRTHNTHTRTNTHTTFNLSLTINFENNAVQFTSLLLRRFKTFCSHHGTRASL